jgi:hypothetical protein
MSKEATISQLKADVLAILDRILELRTSGQAATVSEAAATPPPPINPNLPQVTLLRVDNAADCTMGVLLIDGRVECLTLELPWRDNQRNISCIPACRYICRMITRPNGSREYEVTNVRGRTAILFHSGNTVRDIQGCILPGSRFGTLRHNDGVTNRAVLESKAANDAFKAKLGGKDFELNIVEVKNA